MRSIALGVLFFVLPAFVAAGTQTFSTPGSHTFTVPAYTGTLQVQVWGGGGGGDGINGCWGTTPIPGTAGGTSHFNNTLIANGGASTLTPGFPGTTNPGGTASGGTTNTTGGSGQAGGASSGPNGVNGGAGGDGANGGDGGLVWYERTPIAPGSPGTAPGGGGASARGGGGRGCLARNGSGGGGGGYTARTYTAGTFAAGSNVSIQVGAGGAGGSGVAIGGNGAPGRVTITWQDAVASAPTCTITLTPGTIDPDEDSLLQWSSQNAETFFIQNVGYVTGSGSARVSPSQTTTYAGTVENAGGTSNCSGMLTVNEEETTCPVVVCPAGYRRIGAECVLESCPTGQVVQDGQCVLVNCPAARASCMPIS